MCGRRLPEPLRHLHNLSPMNSDAVKLKYAHAIIEDKMIIQYIQRIWWAKTY